MSAARKVPPGFAPFDLSLLQVDTVVDFDIHLWAVNSGVPVLYRNKDLPFLEEHRQRLLQSDSGQVLIRKDNVATFNRYIERNLDRIITNPALPTKAKAKILYQTSLHLVQDILEAPDAPENFKRSEDVVRNTIGYILHGKDSFHQLMSLTSYDYYTYTHSVNVCTIGLALAEQVGMRSQTELMDFGVGAIFHDVGKTKIPSSILRKRGPLTDEEWTQMRRHPELGVSLLDPEAPFSADSLAVILEHHERLDGSGYPKGKKEGEIHSFAKVAAIVDCFDALTTRRSYRDAVGSYPALKVMKEEVGSHFDSAYFSAFVRLLGK